MGNQLWSMNFAFQYVLKLGHLQHPTSFKMHLACRRLAPGRSWGVSYDTWQRMTRMLAILQPWLIPALWIRFLRTGLMLPSSLIRTSELTWNKTMQDTWQYFLLGLDFIRVWLVTELRQKNDKSTLQGFIPKLDFFFQVWKATEPS